jgi:hypothetical protein
MMWRIMYVCLVVCRWQVRHDGQRPGVEDRGWSSTSRVLGGRTIRMLGNIVCGLYRAHRDKEHRFLGWASKPRVTVFSGLASNRWRRLFLVWPQNRWLGFPSLGLKTGSYGLVIWVSKLPQWFLGLCLKTKRTSVCRLRHKTDGERKT